MPQIFFGGQSSSMIFVLLAALLLVFGLIRPQAVSGLRIVITDAFTPVLSAIASPFQNVAGAISNVSGVTALRAENSQLKAENVRLKEWYQTALMLQAENQSLQDLLNIKLNPAHNYITARTISDAGNSFVKTILITSGRKEGIKNNQAVLSGEGMIGRIIETGENSSRVLLITDINSRIPIIIEGSQQKAIMSGNNTDYPILKYISVDSSLTEGARVVTSGDGGVFPSGFPIGRLVKNSKGELVVKPFAEIGKVTFVRVIDVPLDHNLIHGQQNDLGQLN